MASLTSLCPHRWLPFPLDAGTHQDFLRICMQIAGCRRGTGRGTLFRASPAQLLRFPGPGRRAGAPPAGGTAGLGHVETPSKASHDFRGRAQVLPIPRPWSATSIRSAEGSWIGAGKNKSCFDKASGSVSGETEGGKR